MTDLAVAVAASCASPAAGVDGRGPEVPSVGLNSRAAKLTPLPDLRQDLAVDCSGRSLLGAALAAALSLPLVLSLGFLATEHHDHDSASARLAFDLLHGHRHNESTPDHEHGLAPKPDAVRAASLAFAPQPTPSAKSLEGADDGGAQEITQACFHRLRRSTDPPLLARLCTLRV